MRLPLTLGAFEDVLELERAAILRHLDKVLATDPGSHAHAEVYAEAGALDTIWAVNARSKGAMVPALMLETLPTWEQACGLRPAPSDSDQARRQAVAARFRGYAGNSVGDAAAAAAEAAGGAYVDTVTVDPADVITYWPGINPGPPGFEWTSNRAVIAVVLTSDGMSAADYSATKSRVANTLDAMLPAWMTFHVGSDSGGFICDVGICDETYL